MLVLLQFLILQPCSTKKQLPSYFETLSQAATVMSADKLVIQDVLDHAAEEVLSIVPPHSDMLLGDHAKLETVTRSIITGSSYLSITELCRNHTSVMIRGLLQNKVWAHYSKL